MAKNVTKKELNRLLGGFGLVITALLLLAAGGSYLGYNFATTQVGSQLEQQNIYFPEKGSPALDPEKYPGLQQYAGQQVDNGVKAKAYADEYIWVHMMDASDGKTYAEVSSEARANPDNEELAALKTTLFQGNMLRSSLLTAYAFSVFGTIAGYAAVASLLGAAVMFLLSMRSFLTATRS